MSNTPLEQNGADLASILTAINNLPEYSEVPLAVKVDLFTAYNAAKIAEYVDTINLADDTTFLSLESYSSDATIKAATAESDNRKHLLDLDNYTYITTAEHRIVPVYDPQPDKSCFVGGAGMEVKIFSLASPNPIAFTVYRNRFLEWTHGYQLEDTGQTRGFIFGNTGFASYNSTSKYLYFIQPTIILRPNGSYFPESTIQAIDAANTNFHVRHRLFRVPNDQFIGKMRSVSNDMITYDEFEEEFPNGSES